MTTGPGQPDGHSERFSLGRSVGIGVALGAVLLVTVVAGMRWWEAAGRWSSTPIDSISQSGDDGYELYIRCGVGEARASVLEFDDRVMVSAEITGGVSQYTCARILHMTLVEPIGDRIVIGRTTGDAVKVIDRGR